MTEEKDQLQSIYFPAGVPCQSILQPISPTIEINAQVQVSTRHFARPNYKQNARDTGFSAKNDWLIDWLIFPVSVMHNKMLASLLREHMDCKGITALENLNYFSVKKGNN